MEQPDPTWDSPQPQDQSDQSSEKASETQTQESDAEIKFTPVTVSCPQGGHTFYHTASMSVKCRGCPVGYNLGAGTYLKDGHIFSGDQLLI